MPNLRLALRTLFKSPFVTLVAILSLALGIGANSAIFSLFDQMLLRPLPVPNAEELVNFKSPGPEARLEFVQSGGRMRRDFQLPDVQGPREGANQLHRHCGASKLWRQRRLPGHLAQRRRPARVGQLLSRARLDAGDRPPLYARGRQDGRQSLRGRAQLRLLEHPLRAQSQRAQRDAGRQRPGDDGRRRDAARVQRHHARQQPGYVRADDDARVDEPGIQRLRESPSVLGLPVRAPEAGRVDGAGDRRDQRSVSRRSSTTSKRRCRRA